MSRVGGDYFHPKRESLGMGCVISYAVPKHCAAQVHNSDAALNDTERAAAALSAAPSSLSAADHIRRSKQSRNSVPLCGAPPP